MAWPTRHGWRRWLAMGAWLSSDQSNLRGGVAGAGRSGSFAAACNWDGRAVGALPWVPIGWLSLATMLTIINPRGGCPLRGLISERAPLRAAARRLKGAEGRRIQMHARSQNSQRR